MNPAVGLRGGILPVVENCRRDLGGVASPVTRRDTTRAIGLLPNRVLGRSALALLDLPAALILNTTA